MYIEIYSMCIYIYIYMYMYMYIYICVYVYVYGCICMCIYIYREREIYPLSFVYVGPLSYGGAGGVKLMQPRHELFHELIVTTIS